MREQSPLLRRFERTAKSSQAGLLLLYGRRFVAARYSPRRACRQRRVVLREPRRQLLWGSPQSAVKLTASRGKRVRAPLRFTQKSRGRLLTTTAVFLFGASSGLPNLHRRGFSCYAEGALWQRGVPPRWTCRQGRIVAARIFGKSASCFLFGALFQLPNHHRRGFSCFAEGACGSTASRRALFG